MKKTKRKGGKNGPNRMVPQAFDAYIDGPGRYVPNRKTLKFQHQRPKRGVLSGTPRFFIIILSKNYYPTNFFEDFSDILDLFLPFLFFIINSIKFIISLYATAQKSARE